MAKWPTAWKSSRGRNPATWESSPFVKARSASRSPTGRTRLRSRAGGATWSTSRLSSSGNVSGTRSTAFKLQRSSGPTDAINRSDLN
ncbi:UNVERIFIED_CONTAM: hypothetical protein GTU68_052837 [Idotea baltica]|nr:hypothetical protein [Idotea baltica]